jgi:hypothetical protein
MPDTQDRIIDDLMEHLITQGPEGMATVFTRFFNLAMRFERENFLGARHYGAEGPSVRKRTLRKASEGHFGGRGA